MARGRKPKPVQNPSIASLHEALKYLSPCVVKDSDKPSETHCQIAGGRAWMFNGAVAMGCMVDIDTTANPELERFLLALSKCQQEVSITQTKHDIVVTSGKFKAHIPCLGNELFMPIVPANPIAQMDDRFRKSIGIVGRLAKESAARLMEASVYTRANSALCSNGHVIIESWHGNDMPPMTIPKKSSDIICKIDKPIRSFGLDWVGDQVSALTIWFDDGSFFKTQLYVEAWPEFDRLLDAKADLWPIPDGFWSGLETIADLVEDTSVWCNGHKIATDSEDEATGASIEIRGNIPACRFNPELLLLFKDHAEQIDFMHAGQSIKLQGEGMRGLVAKINRPNADK